MTTHLHSPHAARRRVAYLLAGLLGLGTSAGCDTSPEMGSDSLESLVDLNDFVDAGSSGPMTKLEDIDGPDDPGLEDLDWEHECSVVQARDERPGYCTGPWKYKEYKTCEFNTVAECGDCDLPMACEASEHDIDWYVVYSVTLADVLNDDCAGGICTLKHPDEAGAHQRCNQRRLEEQAEFKADPHKINVTSSMNVEEVGHTTNTTTFDCNIVIRYDYVETVECGCFYTSCFKQDERCGIEDEWIYTTKSMPKPTSPAIGVSKCTTADDIAPSNHGLRYKRLRNHRDDPNLNEATRKLIVQRIKLLLETVGAGFGDAKHANGYDDYATYPLDWGPRCGPFPWEMPECPEVDTDWRWTYCTRMAEDWASPDDYALDVCLPLIAEPSKCMHAHAHKLSRALSDKRINLEPRGATVDAKVLDGIRNAFYIVGRMEGVWSSFLDPLEAGAEVARAAQMASMNAEARRGLSAEAQAEKLDDLLGDGFEDSDIDGIVELIGQRTSIGMEIDRQILVELFTGDLELGPAATVYFTAQAFGTLTDRLDALSQFHDFGCLFVNCEVLADSTPISSFWRLIAALDDPTAFDAALLASQGADLSGWREVFEAIDDNHARLLDALEIGAAAAAAAAEAGEELSDLPLPSMLDQIHPGLWPEIMQGFVAIANGAQARIDLYDEIGQLTATPENTFRTTVDSFKREQVFNHIQQEQAVLSAFVEDYKEEVYAIARGIAEGSEALANVAELEVRHAELSKQLDDLREKRFAHLDAAAEEVEAAQGLATILETVPLDEGEMFTYDSFNFTVSGADVPSFAAKTLPEMAVGEVIHAAPGQVVKMTVSGEWSPTCSLSNMPQVVSSGDEMGAPLGQVVDLQDPSGALIGPEGFTFAASGDSVKVDSATKSKDKSFTLGTSAQVCVEAPLPVVSMSACSYAQAEMSWSKNSAVTHSTDTSTSLTLQKGLRIEKTPVRSATVGSLLAIEVPTGATSLADARQIHPISRETTIVVKGDSDLYVIGNDYACAGADTRELSVEGNVMSSEADIAKVVVPHLSMVLAEIRGRLPDFVARREILATEIESLRHEVELLMLQAGAPISYDEYPPPVRDIFDAFVSRELLILERAVRIGVLELEERTLEAEIVGVEAELRHAYVAKELSILPAKWRLRNLRTNYLRASAANLARVMRNYGMPFLRLWYPQTFDNLYASEFDVTALLNITLESDLTQQVIRVADAVGMATAAYNNVAIEMNDPTTGVLLTNLVILSLGSADGIESTSYPMLPQAGEVWDAIVEGHDVTVHLQPSDLHFTSGTQTLSCFRQLPVVRRAAFIARGNNVPYFISKHHDVNIAPSQNYATTDGLVTLTLENPAHQWISLAVVKVGSSLVADVYSAWNTASGLGELDWIGLSPYAAITLDFAEGDYVGLGLDRADELMLMLEIETMPSAQPLSWIPNCAD